MKVSMILGAALAALVVLLAAACGGGEEGGEGTEVREGEVSGTVKLRGWGNPVEKALLQSVVNDFEKQNPKVKVNYQVIEGDYPAAMTAAFSARKPPDVFYVDSSLAPDWIGQQLLEPLDGFIEANNFDTGPFFDPLVEAFRSPRDEKLYGLPKDWSPLATFTNRKMVDDAGVEVPTNWDELKSAAQTIKVRGGAPVCLDDDLPRWMPFFFQNGGSFLNEDRTEVTVNSPEVKEAIDFWAGLYDAGLVATPEKLGVGWCGEAIGKNKAAIVFEGNWAVPFLEETFPKLQYEIHPMIQGEEEANMAFTVSYSIAADSENKEAAWALLSFLVGPEGMKKWTSKGLALPSREDVEPVQGREVFIDEADHAEPWVLTENFTRVYDTFNNELTRRLEGDTTTDELLEKTEKMAQRALEE